MSNKRKELVKFPKLELELLRNKKKSEVLFILGSSSAINDISKNNWDYVSKHDSMAMNNFCYHEFIPDFYWLELSNNIPAMHFTFNEISKKYNDTKPLFILNYDNIRNSCVKIERLPQAILDNYCFVQPKPRFGNSQKEILSNLSKLSKEINENKVGAFSYQHVRGSLFTCCQIGWSMGYKKIVLLGVSLNDQKYFYEGLCSENAKAMLRMVAIQEKYEARVGNNAENHRTVRKNTGTNAPSIVELCELLNKHFLLPSKIELYIQDSESLLAECLPIYSWRDN